MAETKTRSSSGRNKTTQRKKTSRRKPTTGKSRKRTATKSQSNGAGRADAARKAVEGTAKQTSHVVGDAGRSVGKAASKAKTPLLASGAALAGVAGGIAIGARGARQVKGLRRPKVKIDSHDLAKAAKEVGQFGMDVGQLASELRRNREQANGAKRRSPVEVVLDGLTHRGNGS
jgi:hypothetical protein